MLSLFDAVRFNPGINRLEIGDFLFAEFTCGLGDETVGLWAHQDYLVHVLTGRKTWHTPEGRFVATPGETLFFRKGAAVVEQHLEIDFCLLLFFIPDDLVRAALRDVLVGPDSAAAPAPVFHSALRVAHDATLNGFLSSMREYFSASDPPPEPLLRLKVRELLLSLVTGGGNPELAFYLRQVADTGAPPVAGIMEENFRYNLTLEEYARLCHRSLSSFKREFQRTFGMPPGKWLLGKRTDYAAALLRGSRQPVTGIAYDSGFEDVSHFSRVFRQRFGTSPTRYRETAGS